MTEKMDSKSHSPLIFISLSSLLLIFSSFAEATCKPEFLTYPIPPPPPSPKQPSPLPKPIPASSAPTKSPLPAQPTPIIPAKAQPADPTPTPAKAQPADSISLVSGTPTTTPTTTSSAPKPTLHSIPSAIPAAAGGINAAIKDLCAKTDHLDVCLSTIAPFVVPGKTDPVSVFGMQLQALNAHAQAALATATQIFLNPLTPPTVKSCLDDCKDVYSDAIDNLKSAADALTKRDFPTVDTMLSAAISDFGTCDDGFSDFPGLKSPMTIADDLLNKMTSNLLALSSVCKSP